MSIEGREDREPIAECNIWNLYQVVGQNTMRTCGVEQVKENNSDQTTGVHIFRGSSSLNTFAILSMSTMYISFIYQHKKNWFQV